MREKPQQSIHHDHEYQTLPQMSVYIRDTKYLYFHVGHVAIESTLMLLIALATKALSSSHAILASPCENQISHHKDHAKA